LHWSFWRVRLRLQTPQYIIAATTGITVVHKN
jgi:hypothetical protein